MKTNAFLLAVLAVLSLLPACSPSSVHDTPAGPGHNTSGGTSYYISPAGLDTNSGSKESPWRTLAKISSSTLVAGDSIRLEGGQVFDGTISIDSNDFGSRDAPIVINSFGSGTATISAGNSAGLTIMNSHDISIANLHLKGAGRKNGNTESGLVIMNASHNISIDEVEIEGFQKSGLNIYASSDLLITRVRAHDNGAAGISVGGNSSKDDSRNIVLRNCSAENNPGDPTELDNHSGNGIIVGMCRNVLIDSCTATNNGWDMPRIGNGPVGIWAWEADSVIVQHCISYRNKTSVGGEDGGGFDFDGGVTNSTIQYCLTYENQGSGFGIFQYSGASVWSNNTVRYNISVNDGTTSTAKAGVYVWNGSRKAQDFKKLYFYNNTIYNDSHGALAYAPEFERTDFFFYNNIFIGTPLVRGSYTADTFLANDWWKSSGGFDIDGTQDLSTWANQTGKEKKDGSVVGLSTDPAFPHVGVPTVTRPEDLDQLDLFAIPSNSLLRTKGLDLNSAFGIATGGVDFHGKPAVATGIGASY